MDRARAVRPLLQEPSKEKIMSTGLKNNNNMSPVRTTYEPLGTCTKVFWISGSCGHPRGENFPEFPSNIENHTERRSADRPNLLLELVFFFFPRRFDGSGKLLFTRDP